MLQLASAVCLAALGSVWHRRPEESYSAHRAVNFTIAGSLCSAVLLALAAITSWSLASPGVVGPGSAFRTLQFLPFLFGGPGWAAFFALFMLGVSRATANRVPKWIEWPGYGLSITSAFATFALITLAAAPFLPLTRFRAFLWLIAAAVFMNRSSKL